ncbi:NEL-type E3 ubiquitin ligase domain-containing protein [Pseudomonas brassicacearum]|uniref:NEL-type E3 ubiquitin ligase domain-containing protein n=1 Tax=Pseudomonas brassicacearum TaxID=930166 RepID=UPI001BDF1C06|nr:NEL-type E3 ubiquitin ligase domain-containing protein [Pseudomonas brassicacearum]
MSPNSTQHPEKIQSKPPVTESLHADFLEAAMPAWLIEASTQRRQAMKQVGTQMPAWYANASPEQRKVVDACFKESVAAQNQLDKTMSSFQDIDTFARPLLVQALKDQFKIELDVDKTLLCLRRATEMGVFRIEIGTFELLKLPMLQAALHNFESWECDHDAYHHSSGFVRETGTPDAYAPVALSLSVSQFLTLCRTLDIGTKYQAYLKSFFYPADAAIETTLRQHFIASQKTAMRAAAEQALLAKDIEPGDHAMILSVIEGENNPWLGKKPVWFEDMTVMKQRLVGCVAFTICEMHRYSDETILYVPHDPEHPLKRYNGDQLKTRIKQLLTTPDTGQSQDIGPTPYQRFFSQFVPYDMRPYFFSQFVQEAAHSLGDTVISIGETISDSPWMIFIESANPAYNLTYIKNPAPKHPKMQRESDPYIAASTVSRKGQALWDDNLDPWDYLYDRHREKVLADARSHAVPTDDVDTKARDAKLAHLMEEGLFALNLVSMFVPVLGEVMMVVMAGQLLYETLEGAVEWGEGDKRAAKAHLIDVAENLALMGAMAGVGAGVSKLAAIKPEPVIECLEPVTLPNGETRLWKPELSSYESAVTLTDTSTPNALGQYEVDGKTHIRLGGKVHEQFFDASIHKWRIKHPTDEAAYQPILLHDGNGAWRHSLERPMAWDRLTLLRRMGHETAAFSDEMLLRLADVSGVSDNALRKMHMDRTMPPPELRDAMRLFKADAEAAQVIDQLQAAANLEGLTRQQVFERIYKGTEPVDGRIRILQRECPGLSEAAAQEVIAHGSAADLARLDARRRAPLSMLEEARWYARQGRQVRAYGGLHSDNIVSADSRRLALHALERLPGWPVTLRLEVREGSDAGALLESIGDKNAPEKKYLIKNGPGYQAFNELGDEPGGMPLRGGNFYRSILQVLPADARSALGLPEGNGPELQRMIIDYAYLHRGDMTQLLETPAKRFKPPVRVSATLKGYYASGRGRGMHPSIEARVEALYPSEPQAEAFIRQQRGKTERQIYLELQTRQREWESLDGTLEQWLGETLGSPADAHKNRFAQALRDGWRNRPLAQESPEGARLVLSCEVSLPPIATHFAHVRELSVIGGGMTDANADAFLALFPGVTKLEIGLRESGFLDLSFGHPPLTTLPHAVSQMPGLTDLRFSTAAVSLAESFPQRLSSLTSLEVLHIDYSGFDQTAMHNLDLTPLSRLRTLKIEAPQTLSQWPEYVQRLPRLERLELSRTSIRTLPDAIFEGHEKLWAGLSLNWSALTPQAFARAYRYVSEYSGAFGHLVDVDQMVDGYCRGQLRLLVGEAESVGRLPVKFDSASNTPQERFAAVEALRAEHDGIFAQFFFEPTGAEDLSYALLSPVWWEGGGLLFRALRDSWRGAVRQRLGLPTAGGSLFELPVSGSALPGKQFAVLPALPPASFSHVETLRLGSLDVSPRQARNFFRAFSGTRTLEISGNGFTELPFDAEDLPALTQLDMRNNNLLVTPTVQAQFNGLTLLEQLNLENNPLETLDVSALTRLKALGLKATQLRAWPAGAENLTQLSWLDLRDNQLQSFPPTVLSNDEVLIKTHLAGNLFSPEGEAALSAAYQRVEDARGLPHGALARFAKESVPDQFPPTETSWSIAQLLLPPPEASAVVEGDAGRKLRLQRLDPILTQEQAALKLGQWRENGMTETQIDDQVSQWHQSCVSLTRRLNDWLFIREVRVAGGTVSAQSRALAAKSIREVWQEGLIRHGGAGQTLSLHGLQLGDLPELGVQFPGVTTLELSGVLLTERGSNGFFGSFAHLNRLDLGGNELTAVPDAVLQMEQLEHLGFGDNYLPPAAAYPLLTNGRLRSLNLTINRLVTFDPPDFGQIEALDLSYNDIESWPSQLLNAQELGVLNLSGNEFTDLPAGLLDGSHQRLVDGMDLSDNEDLSLNTFYELRDYLESGNREEVLGFSRDEIDSLIATSEAPQDDSSDFNDDSDGGAGANGRHDPHASVAAVEPLLDPTGDASAEALSPWLVGSNSEQITVRSRIWAQLAEENDHERFFQLLALLPDTFDFRFDRAELTRRVWNIMDAASENSELRQLLFQNAETHGTCIDGRILTFSELEVRVFVFQALRDIPLERPLLRGQALLRLSRQLFRLERVETLAEAAGQGRDRAEVRLRYRIGLTSGWGDGIDLPGQPTHMAFGAPITGELAARTRTSILEAERSDALLVSMASRDYWTTYLQERHPEQMRNIADAVANRRHELLDALEDRRADGGIDTQRYNLELNALGRTVDALRTEKLVELTRSELNDLRSAVGEAEQSGTRSPQPGPSRRN